MGKFKKGGVREAKEELQQEAAQKQLHEKHGITDPNTVIVEKSNMAKFLVRCTAGTVRIIATTAVFILAAIGLVTLIYPEIRQEFIRVLQTVLNETRNMIGF